MKVLLSIKPEFAEKIFLGTKKFEFRRSVFKNPDIKTIVVYVSYPIQRVIGEFEIETILNYDLTTLWELTKDFAGISKSFFMEYFHNKENGYAIKIKKTKKYATSLCLKETFKVAPPQSFLYLKADYF